MCNTHNQAHLLQLHKKNSHVEVIPRSFHVFMLEEVAMWQAFSTYFSFALSITFYEYSINTFHLSAAQTTWSYSGIATLNTKTIFPPLLSHYPFIYEHLHMQLCMAEHQHITKCPLPWPPHSCTQSWESQHRYNYF